MNERLGDARQRSSLAENQSVTPRGHAGGMWFWYIPTLPLLIGLALVYARRWGWFCCFMGVLVVLWLVNGSDHVNVLRGQ